MRKKVLLRQYWTEFIRMTWQWNFLNALRVNKVIIWQEKNTVGEACKEKQLHAIF